MFKKAGKKTSKVLAYLLALMVMVGYVPAEIIISAVAADEATLDYNFIVTNGLIDDDLVEYEGATIVIKNGEELVGEVTTDENGEATAEGLVDATEYSYTVTLLGYEDVTGSFTADSATDPKEVNVTMTALQVATITGTVTDGTDAYEGATVTLSGYSEDSATTDENGEYTLSGYVGKAYTVTVTPKAEDEAKFSPAERTFTPDSADYDLATIDLSVATYKVSAAVGITNGTVKFYSDEEATTEITGDSLNTIAYGTNVTVKVEADEDYRIKTDSFSVTGDGISNVELDNDNKFTFTVKSAVAVSVEFEQYLFDVNDSVTGENHGTVSFDGLTNTGKAEKDSTVKISVSADQGYCIESMEVNGTSIDNIDGKKLEEYTIDSVENDIEVVVKYRVKTYKITFTVDNNGNVKYNDVDADIIIGGSIDVEKIFNESEDLDNPTKVTVTAIPNTGWRVENVTIDGSVSEFDENNKNHTCDFEMTQDHTYAVTFAKNVYTVTGVINDTAVTSNADGSIEVKNGNSFNYGDDVTIKFKPTKKHNSQKQVQTLKVEKLSDDGTVIDTTVLSRADLILDNSDYNTATDEYTLKNVDSNVKVSVLFDNIAQLNGGWEQYVSVTPTYVSSEIDETTKTKTYIYSNNVTIKPVDTNTYSEGVDFLVDGNEHFIGMETNRIIEQSTTIALLQVKGKSEYSVNLDGYKLVFLIDKTKPIVSTENDVIITNTDTVTITGTVTDENTTTNPSSGLERVVYTTGTKPADETAVKALTTEATLTDGKFEINVDGTAELNTTYYIYAIDTAGNVSEAKAVNVVIDKVAPVISDVTFPANTNVENDGNVIKVSSTQAFDMTVTANDVTEITEGEGESAITTQVVSAGLKNAVITYKQNGELKEPISIDFTSASVTPEILLGTYTDVYVTVYDKAGNESVKKGPYTLVVDNRGFKTTDNSVSVDALEDNQKYSATDKIWFANENVELNFNLSHTNSYVKPSKVVVSVNGADFICEDVNANDDIYSYSCKFINTDGTSALDVGENKVNITVTSSTKQVTTIENAAEFYIDKTPATIEKFDFAVKNQNKSAELINFLTFGIFCNQEIEVTVTAADTVDTGAGVKTITLLAGDGYLLGEVEVEDNKATFTIPADEVTDNALHFNKTISAVATDNVGNTTKIPVFPNTDNSNAKSSGLMIETINPTIVVDYPEEPANQNEKTATAGEWYNGDIDFTFDIKDNESGIRSVVISINGETLVDKIYKENDTDIEEHEGKFNVSTSQVEANTDGSYKLEATVIDNAGNVNNMKPVTVYKDTDAPYITKFAFEGTGYKESSEEKAVAQITDYGFYFTADTKVTVYAEDAIDADGKKIPSAGIKEIICYTQAVNQTEKVEVTDVTANADGTYSFTIIAGFKGQIFAEVNDNVGNGSGICSPDKAVVESQEQHNAAAEAHVAFSVPETTVKTASGSPLYKATVPVSIVVTDTFAGIRKIEWSVEAPYDKDNEQKGEVIVGNDKTIEETITEGRETGWSIDATDSNLITKMSKTITVNNNSNGIVVKVTMTDRAGNTTTDDISFSIDKTAPVIEVTYDNNTPDAEYDSFYKANRTATITVTERNFNPDDVKIVIENTDGVIPKLSNWTKTAVEDGVHPDGTVHTAKIEYVADGDYTFDIAYSDLATNDAEDFTPHAFTIDKTKPVVKVTYDNNKALNKNYYDAERTATITVTEHNFDASRIVVTGEATDNGKKIKFPAITGWSSKGDVHTTTINYKADAEYTFDIKVTDKADNVDDSYKAETFFVDKTAPEVEITGVANNSANNGKVAPVVNYTDTNFTEDGVTVTLTGVNRGRVDYSRGVANVANGQTMSYENFRNVKEVDDIYTLTAKVVDKAGNETTKSITFSVNRFGSTYNLEAVKSYNNKYIQSMGDLVFTEVNVNSLDLGNIRVKLTKNGTPSDLVMNQDFTVDVAGGGGRWYTYTYTIKSALFQDDAKYSLSFYSVDASGNVNENIDETKEAVVSFAVDKTNPVIIPIDLADGERYKETVKNVTIEVKDNLLLEDVKIYLNDSEVEYTVEGESYTIQVPESTERQTIKIIAVDAAGNEYETVVKDFLVSTNAFVQFVNNTPVFIGSIAAVVVVIGAIIAFIILGKKKRRK